MTKLDHSEAFNAAIAGLMRRFRAIQRNASDTVPNATRDLIATDIHGAIAESLVAKALGLYCNAFTSDRTVADVGTNIEVRSTPKTDGPLIVRPKDSDDRKYYLVAGLYPDIAIIGWLYGREAKKPEYWVSNYKGMEIENPYWSVPQRALHTDLIEFSY